MHLLVIVQNKTKKKPVFIRRTSFEDCVMSKVQLDQIPFSQQWNVTAGLFLLRAG
jgi:hypothetical protein